MVLDPPSSLGITFGWLVVIDEPSNSLSIDNGVGHIFHAYSGYFRCIIVFLYRRPADV